MEGNHAALSGITLPTKSGGSGEKDALMEHTLAPRWSKEEVASAAYRQRRLTRYEKVRKLHEQGMSIMVICRTLGMSRGAVRRYVRADAFPAHRRHPPQRSMLDPFKPYLAKRWEEGCHVAMQLWREIADVWESELRVAATAVPRRRMSSNGSNLPLGMVMLHRD